ncbi:MAG TPA: hypothetical protein VE177_06085 [Candidatus Binatus sp.]|jgi:hypothetical protein|nr:hypothetical protein [Candidatus Binatus sp.]
MAIRGSAVTVPEAIRQILTRNYPLYQCLKMRVVNYHSLAELVRPQVQEATGREASINTLVVAIKRFADTLGEIAPPAPSALLNGARISLSSGIVDVTIKALKSQFPRIIKDVAEIGDQLTEFPHIFPLATSVKIILPSEDYEVVKKKLESVEALETRMGVAKLTIFLTPGAEMTPGLGSYITELLYRNGINVLDAFLGYGDIIMVVSGEDGPVGFNILQKEVNHTSKNPHTTKVESLRAVAKS